MKGEFKIIVGAILFSVIPIGVLLAKDLPICTLLFFRLLLVSLILFFICRKDITFKNLPVMEWLKLIFWSLVILGAMLCYFTAINSVGMAISSNLLGLQPVFILLFSSLLLKEKISKISLVATIICVFALFFILDFSFNTSMNHAGGILLGILSAFLMALNFIFKKKFLTEYKGNTLVFYQCTFQLPFLLPLISFSNVNFSFPAISGIIMLGLFSTVLAYTLIYDGSKTVEGQKIGILQCSEYVLPVFIGVLFFNAEFKSQMQLLS